MMATSTVSGDSCLVGNEVSCRSNMFPRVFRFAWIIFLGGTDACSGNPTTSSYFQVLFQVDLIFSFMIMIWSTSDVGPPYHQMIAPLVTRTARVSAERPSCRAHMALRF